MIRLVLITEGEPAPVRAALGALPRGGALVQLRNKALGARALLERTLQLRDVCRALGAPLLVNDRADVALQADGVHLPATGLRPGDARALLGPQALIGVSCHSAGELTAAWGADFALFGAVFDTPGKPARGLDALEAACRAAPLPVYAVGGLTAQNAQQAMARGAAGVACIRSVLGARDPALAAAELWRAVTA